MQSERHSMTDPNQPTQPQLTRQQWEDTKQMWPYWLTRMVDALWEYRERTNHTKMLNKFYSGGGHGDPLNFDYTDDIAKELGLE